MANFIRKVRQILPKPLMPQGVEHTTAGSNAPRSSTVLPKPLMPQGVEHSSRTVGAGFTPRLPKPLMPQGVEHYVSTSPVGIHFGTAQASDAARR